MKSYVIENKINALPLGSIRFEGAIRDASETFFRERVTSDYAFNVIYPETEIQFTNRDDDKFAVGTWRGEFWGKWIISASRVAKNSGDERLKEFIHKAALNVIATQDEDGYIGSYRDPENVKPCDPKCGLEVYGVLCDHNWNVWCRKYILWGLLEAYMLTEDKVILDATVRFANQLIDMLARLGLKISDCGTFNGLPAGSIMKPMLILHRLTGDGKYLEFAISIADDWEREDGRMPNLISNALMMKPVHTWYPLPEKWAKAYELMSCLDGLVELYRITGTERYLTACENMYELLKEHEENLLFSVGFNDQLSHGAAYPNSITEPCDVIHWMRLCYELYTLSGDVKYMNTIERAFYNPLLASFFKDGKWGARGCRSVGRHMVASGQAGMQYSHCCVNNVPRGILNALECFVMRDDGGLTVNLYTDYTAECSDFDIKIRGSYLTDGKVNITLNTERDMTLSLRIPAWSPKTTLNGTPIEADGGYYRLKVKKGETVIDLNFDLAIVLRTLREAPTRYPKEDFRVRRFCYDNVVTDDIMTWDIRSTLLYGPLLLTRSKLVGNTEEEMFVSESISNKGFDIAVTPIDCEGVVHAFLVTFKNNDETVSFNMCDYASGTNVASYDDMKLFNIFI